MSVQVHTARKTVEDPEDFPEALERSLTVQLLTQTGPMPRGFILTPQGTKALRDTLRAGRRVRDAARQLEAIQAHAAHRLDEARRRLVREVVIWIATAVGVWAWAIWVTSS